MAKDRSDRVHVENAVKTLATNIRFASVDDPVSTLVVTSSIPNEGKSSVAIALAKAMASGGDSVLLVECDLRRRTLADMLSLRSRAGLYAVISGKVPLGDAVAETGTRGLHFLDCEPHIPNPVDILSSQRFRRFVEAASSEYSFVIFDTPPLTAFVDAAVLSSIVDGTLLVVRENFVRRDDLLASYEQLQKAGANVIGAVMNCCEDRRSDYYYSYYAKSDKDAAPAKAPAPARQEPPAQHVAPPQRHGAAPAGQDRRGAQAPASKSETAAPGLRPLPQQTGTSPDTTMQFLAGMGYRPRSYEDE